MELKIKKKTIEIRELTSFWERFKSLKFILEKIDYGIKIPNKKWINTYLFCQRVDVCVTDKDDKIIFLQEAIASEKKQLKRKAKNIYYLPLNTVKYLELGQKLPIKK